jgi:hypothetical protein
VAAVEEPEDGPMGKPFSTFGGEPNALIEKSISV